MMNAVTIAVRRRPAPIGVANDEIIEFETLNENVIAFEERTFLFDKILDENCSQQQIYDDLIKPLVEKVLIGFNATVLAYGQTGTGKSYTMGLQVDELDEAQNGIVSRALHELFARSDSNQMEISVSYIEIYNEKAFDLLSDNPTDQINVKGYKTFDVKKFAVKSMDDAKQILNNGSKKRHVRPTKMNQNSSRSHAIFTIHVEIKHESVVTKSAFNLVDLAGSEGVRRTSHKGAALTEGNHINQGLLTIARVVKALSENAKVIPYRESVLSSVLQDSMNANSFFVLLACISALRCDSSETVATLQFAGRAKTLKNTPQINAVIDKYKKSKTPVKLFKTPLPPRNRFITPFRKKTLSTFVTSTVNVSASQRPNNRMRFSTPSKRVKLSAASNATNVVARSSDTPKPVHKLFDLTTNQTEISKIVPYDDSSDGSSINLSTSTQIPAEETINTEPLETGCEFQTGAQVNTTSITGMVAAALPSNMQNGVSYSPIIRPIVKQCMEQAMRESESRMKEFFTSLLQQTMIENPSRKSNNHFTRTTAASTAQRYSTTSHFTSMQLALSPPNLSIVSLDDSDPTIRQVDNDIITDDTFDFANENTMFEASEATKAPRPKVSTFQLASDDGNSSCNDDTLTENKENIVGPRRSMRINSTASTISIPDCSLSFNAGRSMLRRSSRRSARIGNISSTTSSHDQALLVDVTKRATNVTKKRKTAFKGRSKTVLDKDIENMTHANTETQAKAMHKKSVLDILNSGDLKKLQLLPTIGEKTAYQILTHRSLNGKFKDIKSLEKVSCWRGKGFSRFIASNNLQ